MIPEFKNIREISCDTLVVGGGLAGASAAIASARGGADTVLIEAGGTLGGQAGIGLVTPLDSRTSKSGVKFGGLLDEICDMTVELTKKYVCGGEENVYTVSPHILKYVLLKLSHDSDVKLHFHTVLCEVHTEAGKVAYAIFKDKTGYLKVNAKTFIDATGDADLVYLSGDEYVSGSEEGVFDMLTDCGLDKAHSGEKVGEKYPSGLMQPVSLFFVLRGVSFDDVKQYNNKRLFFGDFGITREKFEKWQFCGIPGFEIKDDLIPTPASRILVSRGRHGDEVVVNMSRVVNINGADADSLSEGEIIAGLQLIGIVDFLKTFIPGFEKCYLVESSSRLGIRETRRLVGKYKLSGRETVNGERFADAVCRGYYIVDIHDPRGKSGAIGGDIGADFFEIPFGSLCSKNFANLLACGRCISCDHVAHSATRIQGVCILTGQAAGCASAIAAKCGCAATSVDADVLRSELMRNGVWL